MTRLIAWVFAVLMLAPGLDAAAQQKSRLQDILAKSVLRIGTTGDFNPMSMRDPATNTYKGFDIDAMEQLAKDMGVKAEFVPAEWATLGQGLMTNKYDIFSGASLNMARARTISFSQPYLFVGTVPVTLKANAAKFASWEAINQAGINIAVSMGTVFEEQAKQHFPKASIKAVQTPATGFQEVLARRAEVTITSNIEAAGLVQRYAELAMPAGNFELRNRRPLAYPVPQGDADWLAFVNSWVTLKHAEGYFDGLEKKWGLKAK
jgi:cyclohexadienyl dehydratase